MRNEVVKTLIIAELILTLVMVVPVLGVQTTHRRRSRRNHDPSIQSFAASHQRLRICALDPFGTCSPSNKIVALDVKASDPDNDELTYKYSVSAGTIVGSGATVNWDLSESRLGVQTASVQVFDQRGGKISATTRVDLVACEICDLPCSVLSVSCPSEVDEGEIANFVATVSGVDPDEKLTYLWRHSNGKRLAAQVGPKLEIKAIGSPGEVITATVTVLGLDPACNREAFCESRIRKRAVSPSEQ